MKPSSGTTYPICFLMAAATIFFSVGICFASGNSDQKSVTAKGVETSSRVVRMARADWDTGWFQAEIFKRLLEALGYRVEGPTTMPFKAFYPAAAKGDIDLWVNGWFPNSFLGRKEIRSRVEAVGFEVKQGALQGYLIDKKTADAHGIGSLKDLQNPQIASLFDLDGDKRADLIGCKPSWDCARIIDHHLHVYGLSNTVEQLKGEYSPLMDKAVKRWKRGSPILFYTWTPNWTIGKLRPGRDVVWLEVPFSSLPQELKHLEGKTVVNGVRGCSGDPCDLGFPPSDIRVMGNVSFLAKHPKIKMLARQFRIDLEDITAQNARMIDGEDDSEDIRRHAREWIESHRQEVDRWLLKANGGTPPARRQTPQIAKREQTTTPHLKVVAKRLEPFVMYENGRYTGFGIDLWRELAQEAGFTFEIYGVDTTAKLVDEIKRNSADVAVSGIGITSRREVDFDFSHPFYESGLQLMISSQEESAMADMLANLLSIAFSGDLVWIVGLFFLVLLAASHIVWMLEKRDNKDFSKRYGTGLWEAFWWAVVTVTTVGYGDKTPKGRGGRLFGLFWILVGYFVFAYFTATVSSTVTVQRLTSSIEGLQDLFGKKVATVERSPSAEFLATQGFDTVLVEEIDDAYALLESGEAKAVVYDAPVLQYHASNEGRGKVEVVGLTFQRLQYGFAMPADSPFRERVNVALLSLIEKGEYTEIHDKWFR